MKSKQMWHDVFHTEDHIEEHKLLTEILNYDNNKKVYGLRLQEGSED